MLLNYFFGGKMFKRILFSFIIILLITQNAVSVVNTFIDTNDAYCISRSYDGTDFITVGRYTGTANSSVQSWTVDGSGFLGSAIDRVAEVTSTTDQTYCGVEDYTQTAVANLKRVVFLVRNGSSLRVDLAYTDSTSQDLGLLGYTPSNPSGYKIISALPFANPNAHIAINSIGDVYTWDDTTDTVYVFDKSNLYASSIVDVVTSEDVDGTAGAPVQINDISVDKDDNVYILAYKTGDTEMGVSIYDNENNLVDQILNFPNAVTNAKTSGFIIPDHVNPLTNFHYGYYNGTNSYVFHYSEGTNTLIGTVSSKEILDGTYINGNIWYSTASATVETIATSYTGFSPTGVAGTPENTYTIKTVDSLRDTYYNNSIFQIYYKLNVETNAVRELDSVASRALYGYGVANNYIWKVSLIDTNGIDINNFYTDHCEDNLLLTECSLSGTLEYKPPKTNWTEGTYYAELWEYNQQNFNYALIATSETWSVGNNSSTPINQPTEPITSGTGENTLTQIDGWVGLLGLGVNGISKFLFAMLITLSITFFGFVGTKGNSMGGAISGALPFTFFVFIEFIPVWTIIIVVMVVAIKTGWFR